MRAENLLRGWPWYALTALLVGLVCAVIGPFGTFVSLALGPRLVYWLAISGLNSAQVLGALWLVTAWRGERWPPVLLALAASFLASLPATAEVLLLEAWLRQPVPPDGWLEVFAYVLLLTTAITVPITLASRRLAQAAALPTPAPAGPSGELLLKRLKPEARGELWALEMEDHYLRVHTSAGNDLILHRLSDALADVAGLEGLQVHRSYWVARQAVSGTERDGRRLLLVLKNGLKVPVSRVNLTTLKSAGWV